MTVSTTTPYKRYSCSGTLDYDFDFVIQQETDLTVTYTDADGVVTLLVLGQGYTVTFDETTGIGYVTTTTVYYTGALEIRRVLPEDQQTRWINNSELDMAILENAMDKLTMLVQQNSVDITEGNQTSSWRGDWKNDTVYAVGDSVTEAATSNIYTCRVANTSNFNGTLQDDVALGYWALSVDYSNIKEAEQNAIVAAAAAAQSALDAAASAEEAYNSANRAEQAIDPNRAVVGAAPVTVSGSTGDIVVGWDKTQADIVRTVGGTAVDNTDPNNPIVNIPVQNGIIQIQQRYRTVLARFLVKGSWQTIADTHSADFLSLEITPLVENSAIMLDLTLCAFNNDDEGKNSGVKLEFRIDGSAWQDVPFIGQAVDNRTPAAIMISKRNQNYNLHFAHTPTYTLPVVLEYRVAFYAHTGGSGIDINYNSTLGDVANNFVTASVFSVAETVAFVGTPGGPVAGYEYYLVKRS